MSTTRSVGRPSINAASTSTTPPAGVYRSAFSTRLFNNTVSWSASPSTTASASPAAPRSSPWWSAFTLRAPTTVRASAARSTGSRRISSPSGSKRATCNNCSMRRCDRSMPASSSLTASTRPASSFDRLSNCSCRRKAVTGVRSSCAASARKRRWVENASDRRVIRPLIDATRGLISCGNSSVDIGASEVAVRVATFCAAASSGFSPRRRATTMSPATKSTSATIGPKIFDADFAAVLCLAAVRCAACATPLVLTSV